jgi:hypothetical protein
MDLYYLYSPRSFRRDCREVHRFADYYVKRALEADVSTNNGGEKKMVNKKNTYVFLDELVKVTRDPQELRGQLLNILLGTFDFSLSFGARPFPLRTPFAFSPSC